MQDMGLINDEIDKLESCGQTTHPVCQRLAYLYTVRDHQQQPAPAYFTQASQPKAQIFTADSDFFQAVSGKDSVAVFDIIDDLMDTLKVVAPRVYASVPEKIKRV